MTKHHALSLCATILLITALPLAAVAETKRADPAAKRIAVQPQPETPTLSARPGAGPTRANDPHDLPCPADEIAVLYEEDASGKPVPGTEVYFCA